MDRLVTLRLLLEFEIRNSSRNIANDIRFIDIDFFSQQNIIIFTSTQKFRLNLKCKLKYIKRSYFHQKQIDTFHGCHYQTLGSQMEKNEIEQGSSNHFPGSTCSKIQSLLSLLRLALQKRPYHGILNETRFFQFPNFLVYISVLSVGQSWTSFFYSTKQMVIVKLVSALEKFPKQKFSLLGEKLKFAVTI